MTDYAATVFGRATLVAVASQRGSVGDVHGDELLRRERELENVLTLRWIEIQDEIKRTSALIGQVATLEGKLRDRDEEIKANWEHLKRLETDKDSHVAYCDGLRSTIADLKALIEHERTMRRVESDALKVKVKELEAEKKRRER